MMPEGRAPLEKNLLLYSTEAVGKDLTWVGEAPLKEGETIRCTCKYRYRQTDQDVEITSQGDRLLIHALTPQRAVTLGQSAVFYHGDVCLGGCVVSEVLNAGMVGTP